MARTTATKHNGLRAFIILLAAVLIGGLLLHQSGYLETPLESALMLANLASGNDQFAMVGGDRLPPGASAAASDVDDDDAVESSAATSGQTSTVSLTLDEFTAQLAAAGVDVDALSADMAAEGRGLDTLMAVVNSGRTTVAELAARLNAASSPAASDTAAPDEDGDGDEGGSGGLLDSVRWDEFGNVAYDLWLFLAVTVAVIVVARPIGWLVNRLKPARRPACA